LVDGIKRNGGDDDGCDDGERETFYNPGMNELKYQATRSPRTVRHIKIIIFFCKFSIFSMSMGGKEKCYNSIQTSFVAAARLIIYQLYSLA
jgi:hypothetical protein